jgi:hypothetical protein
MPKKQHILTVRLNGTSENPWHIYGLKQNPFPQLGKAEWQLAMHQLNSLNGDPIKDLSDLEKRLPNWDPEFIELCKKHFKPGELSIFEIAFPE